MIKTMFDISHISTIDIKTLSEEETESWCSKLLKHPLNEYELDKSDLLVLFQFTRSLLNVKHIQTDVLLEELQNVEQKFEDVQNELDFYRSKSDIEIDALRVQLDDRERQLRDSIQQRQELSSELEQKDRDLMQLRNITSSISQLSTPPDSGITESGTQFPTDEMKLRLKEKNEQIEQLLDKLYDSDRINLDLAEQVAKLRVDMAKSENDNKLLEARCQMLEKQIKELKMLNDNLMQDHERRGQELDRLCKELDSNNKLLRSNDSTTNSTSDKIDFYQQITKELEKLKALLEVKDSEILELREIIRKEDHHDHDVEQLAEKRDHIEHLEEELSILSLGLVNKTETVVKSEEIEQIQQRKLNRRIRKLKKQTYLLQLRTEELEKEARHKDEELVRQRKRMSMLIGGDDRIKKLLEENSVLSRMVRSRDTRIEFLINQLNKHQLVSGSCMDPDQEGLCFQKDINLRDQLIAITVERDVLQRQIDVVKTHLESVHNENLELQMGMKEILEAIRQSDATTDLVLECPSLERVCCLLENRSLYFGMNTTDMDVPFGADLTQMILLKSELDHVRGQNEQLRNELKNLRADFLAVIDEYTTDILDNWTMGDGGKSTSVKQFSSTTSLSDLTKINVNDDDLASSEDSKDIIDSTKKVKMKKSTKGSKLRPRIRIRNRLKMKSLSKTAKKIPATATLPEIEMVDIGLDPIQWFPQKTLQVEEPRKYFENKSSQTSKEIQHQISAGEKALEVKPVELEIVQIISKPDHEYVHLKTNERNDDEDSYVSMCDVEVQTLRQTSFQSRSIQTDDWKPPSSIILQETELASKCIKCIKYMAMLDSVRKLIEKERQHFRLQESKQSVMVDSLKQNLKLVKKEYQLDIDAKNEEIQDLRSKMMKLTTSINTAMVPRPNKNEVNKPEQDHKLAIMMVMDKNKSTDIVDEDEDFNKITNNSQTPSQQQMPINTDLNSSSSKQNKVILETIIECLQKCLKQKDEALEEYRSMIEQMRETYALSLKDSYTHHKKTFTTNDANTAMSNVHNNKNDKDSQPNDNFYGNNNFLELEKIYEDLFVKPKIQENDQLTELLRSTLHQLESVRTKSREHIKQLEMELDVKSRLILELESNLNQLSQQLDSGKNQIRSMETQSKVQEEKIQTLTTKLNDMIRRNQQSVQTATALKKKVENSVFQESADLRSKISELGAEVRRLEVEKWNVEKRLNQERQAARERLAERDRHVTQLSEQMSKLQVLVTNMEKKLMMAQRSKQQHQQTKKESRNRAIQTMNKESQLNPIVRFEQIEKIQREQQGGQTSTMTTLIKQPNRIIKKEVTKSDQKSIKIFDLDESVEGSMMSKETITSNNNSGEIKRTKKIRNHKKNVMSSDPDAEEYSNNSNMSNIREQPVLMENLQEEKLINDSSRQIVIDSNHLERMSTIMNEISIVGTDDKTNMIQAYTIHHHSKIDVPKKSYSPSSSSSSRSKETSSYSLSNENICQEYEFKFNVHRIEQRLNESRSEQLLDEYACLESDKLHDSSSLSSTKKKNLRSLSSNHPTDAKLDCDTIVDT